MCIHLCQCEICHAAHCISNLHFRFRFPTVILRQWTFSTKNVFKIKTHIRSRTSKTGRCGKRAVSFLSFIKHLVALYFYTLFLLNKLHDETGVPFVHFCPLLNLATSSTFKSAECGSHSALLVVSVVLLCINSSTSVATSNKFHEAETWCQTRISCFFSARCAHGLFSDIRGITTVLIADFIVDFSLTITSSRIKERLKEPEFNLKLLLLHSYSCFSCSCMYICWYRGYRCV